MIRKYGRAVAVLLVVMAAVAVAQPDRLIITEDMDVTVPEPNFYIALIVGLILAVAFEMILTHLSVAAGISMVGPLDRRRSPKPAYAHGESSREPTASSSQATHHAAAHGREYEHGGSRSSAGVMHKTRKFSHAFGVWSLVTATISLFFATWFAVELADTGDVFYGWVLGLAIWGLFYLIMTVLETTAISSLVGMLTRTAVSGMQSVYRATASVFSKSPEDRITDAAADIAASVKEELFGDVDVDDLRHKVEKYIHQLRPLNAREMKKELADLLDDVEIKAVAEHEGGPFVDVDEITAKLHTEGRMTQEKAKSVAHNVKHAFDMIRDEYRSGKRPSEKVSDATMEVAGMSEEQARATREKIERYLRETHREELNPDSIKRDIEKLLTHPGEGAAVLRERLRHVDRDTLAAVIASRTDMSEEKAHRIADMVWTAIEKISGKASHAAHQASERTGERVEATQEQMRGTREGVKAKVHDYLDSLGRPELRYEGIKHDMQLLFHDPKAGADALIHRMKAMDRDTLKAILASRRDISEEDAEHIIGRIESARDNTIARAERMKIQIQEKVEHARDTAMHEAEEARKTASAAAWWMFGSAVTSAAAAILGGILAVYWF